MAQGNRRRANGLKDEKGFFTLLGLIFALLLVCIILCMMARVYFKKPVVGTKDASGILLEENIDTSNYKAIVDSVRDKTEEINQQRLNRVNEQLDSLKQQIRE